MKEKLWHTLDDCGFIKNETSGIIEKLVDIIKTSLIAGEDVMISGFGKWSAKSKHARRAGSSDGK